MSVSPDRKENIGVAHGRWGEDVAVEQLRVEGLVVIERNVRPCRADRRIEIDIVAYDRRLDILVFVEVKQHAVRTDRQRRMRSVDRRKRDLIRRGCRAWLAANHWDGAYRFDVIEVYGTPEDGAPSEVDHIRHVRLFPESERVVNWED